jgi:hypothetical protein
MTDKPVDSANGIADVESIRCEIEKYKTPRSEQIFEKFLVAAMGCIPWVGGFLAAVAKIGSEEAQEKRDDMRTKWIVEHQRKLKELYDTLVGITERFKSIGSDIEERIQSDGYLSLVRQAFRTWDKSETDEKRRLISNLITNSAGTRICSDDVVRLFADWVELYHEAHFAVMREIHGNPGFTRYEIWKNIYGDVPREDSAEADLYKLLIRDLSTGGVIRQERDTNALGQYIRKSPPRHRSPAPSTLESAFEDTKPYVLTELGKQFIHYTMNEVVLRIEETNK